MITRRGLLIGLGVAAVVPTALAQQPRRVRRIGFLGNLAPSIYRTRLDAFKAGLRALGYAEGEDYIIELKSSQERGASLDALAAELVRSKVDLILTSSSPTVHAAFKATREIPILTTTAAGVMEQGFTNSLARPSANVTGLITIETEVIDKRVELLRELLPAARQFALMSDPGYVIYADWVRRFEAACSRLGVRPVIAPVRSANDVTPVFDQLARQHVEGLIVPAATTTNVFEDPIIRHAIARNMATVGGRSGYAERGGLLDYEPNYDDLYRRAAAYAAKIFKGAKTADLPIEQPVKFELVINMKTAKTLRIKVPNSILLQATQVIE